MCSARSIWTICMVLFMLHLTAVAFGNAQLNAADQPVKIIEGQTLMLHAAAPHAESFQWFKDGSPVNNATQNTYAVNTSGKYQVLSVNIGDCSSELSDPVTVSVVPASEATDMAISITTPVLTVKASDPFTYTITIKNNGPATATGVKVTDILPDGVKFGQINNTMTGSATYDNSTRGVTWTVGDLGPGEEVTMTFTVTPQTSGDITNTATVTADQADSNPANNTATVINTASGLTIPNVFTPNGDNVNDVFVIGGLNAYPENEFTVVNRWGATVYQKKGYQNNWDGSGLLEGTYFYILKVKSNNQQWNTYRGYITLLRTKL